MRFGASARRSTITGTSLYNMGLEQHFRDIPDGPFWIRGDDLKAFRDELIADRARLAETSGTEEPRENGRFFIVRPGGDAGGTVVFQVSVSGIVGPWNIHARPAT